MNCFYYALKLIFNVITRIFLDDAGEILKLNPSYKAPPDYRPLLKEDRLPLPVRLVLHYLSFVVSNIVETRNIVTFSLFTLSLKVNRNHFNLLF